jgi:hypothetical protein
MSVIPPLAAESILSKMVVRRQYFCDAGIHAYETYVSLDGYLTDKELRWLEVFYQKLGRP